MKIIFMAALLMLNLITQAQDVKKMRKNLTFTLTEKPDLESSFNFKSQNADKHGFEKVTSEFTNSFVLNGLKVSADNARYTIVMEYHYIYKVALYKMQYSNMIAQIIDNQNNKAVIGVFKYDGNFDLDSLSDAIAKNIKVK